MRHLQAIAGLFFTFTLVKMKGPNKYQKHKKKYISEVATFKKKLHLAKKENVDLICSKYNFSEAF